MLLRKIINKRTWTKRCPPNTYDSHMVTMQMKCFQSSLRLKDITQEAMIDVDIRQSSAQT